MDLQHGKHNLLTYLLLCPLSIQSFFGLPELDPAILIKSINYGFIRVRRFSQLKRIFSNTFDYGARLADTVLSRLQPGPLSTRFKYRYHGFARTFFSSMVQVASELGESALSSTVSVGGTNIVRAPEGGRHDCGWYTGSRPLPASGIERLLTISQDGDDQRAQIIPLDVKSNLPRTSADGEVTWKFKFTALQWKHCQAALLFSIKDPNFLALIPRAYFKGTYNIFTVQGSVEYPVASSKGIRPLWTLHPFPAFPPELAPFILPRKDLPKALTDMQAYSQGRTESWFAFMNSLSLAVCR